MAVLQGRLRDAESTSAQLYADQQSDFMDPVTREIEYLKIQIKKYIKKLIKNNLEQNKILYQLENKLLLKVYQQKVVEM